MLKMYIAVLDEVPDHMVPVLVAHATLGAHLQFNKNEFCDDYFEWLNESFRKVVLKVNRKEFEQIRRLSNVYLGYENSVLEGDYSCAVVCPREDNPRVLAFAKMWTSSCVEEVLRLRDKLFLAELKLSEYSWQQDQNSPHRMGL